MSELANSKELYQATCATNSEPYALQNIGDMMSPEFSENCIIIIDPSKPIHNEAFALVDFENELYFRQYVIENNNQLMRCLNSSYEDISLTDDFEVRGCITQQKQRKQKSLHYYLLEKESGEMKFSGKGKEKEITP